MREPSGHFGRNLRNYDRCSSAISPQVGNAHGPASGLPLCAHGGNRTISLTSAVDIGRNADQGYRGQCTDAFHTTRGSQM